MEEHKAGVPSRTALKDPTKVMVLGAMSAQVLMELKVVSHKLTVNTKHYLNEMLTKTARGDLPLVQE